VVVHTTVMNVLTRGGEKEHAMRIFRTMEADGIELDVVRCLLASEVHTCTADGLRRVLCKPLNACQHNRESSA
jgi:pentatricopeptide repeat protein